MKEQPRAMLKTSISEALSTVKKIQSEVMEDKLNLNQLLEGVQLLRIPNNENIDRLETDPGVSSRPKIIATYESDIVTTGCDEELKTHVVFFIILYSKLLKTSH